MKVLAQLVSIVIVFALADCSAVKRSTVAELTRVTDRVRIVQESLYSECPELKPVGKRQVVTDPGTQDFVQLTLQVEIQQRLYEQLVEQLIQCRAAKAIPAECRTAVELTEYWRQEHKGSKINQGNYACDTQVTIAAGRPWFRFTGDAGNRLLNTCPPAYSCGTNAGLWSDDVMPTKVGVVSVINAYRSYAGDCKHQDTKLSVMRVMKCSDKPNDYVYKYEGDEWCNAAFCGMSA